MGYGGIAAVLVAMLAALTVLPATLRLLGRRIDAGRLPGAGTGRYGRRRPRRLGPARPRRDAPAGRASWSRSTVGLLVLASPFLGVKWGSVDYRVLPPDAPAHVAAEKLADEFGAGDVDRQRCCSTAPTGPTCAAYTREVEAVDGVTSRAAGRRARATSRCCAPRGTATARPRRSQDLVARDPRRRPGERRGAGRRARPPTPSTSIDSVGAHLPWMGADRASVVMLVLLFLAFGSLVLPVKAVVMNAAVDHRVVRRRHLDLQRRQPRRACSASPRRASSTRPTRS